MLNWADTDPVPGLSRRECYYITFLPYYDLYVVTVSSNSDAHYGYPDIAIGFGADNVPVQNTVRKAIARFWADASPDDPNGWANYLVEERVHEGTAYRWIRLRRTEEKGA